MVEVVTGLVRQTFPPKRIFFIQNQLHRVLNWSGILKASTVPIVHFWCTNWNSYFFLTYVVMMFIPELYTFKLDDDHIPVDNQSLLEYANQMKVNSNLIVGQGRTTLNRPQCGIKPKFIKDKQGKPDHVAFAVLFRSAAGKVLHRFHQYSYLGAEDVAICLANSMECGTTGKQMRFPVWRHQHDGYSHRNDPQIAKEYSTLKANLFYATFCHFIKPGYKPVIWINYSVGTYIDLRLPH
jgi:hypothetical protein